MVANCSLEDLTKRIPAAIRKQIADKMQADNMLLEDAMRSVLTLHQRNLAGKIATFSKLPGGEQISEDLAQNTLPKIEKGNGKLTPLLDATNRTLQEALPYDLEEHLGHLEKQLSDLVTHYNSDPNLELKSELSFELLTAEFNKLKRIQKEGKDPTQQLITIRNMMARMQDTVYNELDAGSGPRDKYRKQLEKLVTDTGTTSAAQELVSGIINHPEPWDSNAANARNRIVGKILEGVKTHQDILLNLGKHWSDVKYHMSLFPSDSVSINLQDSVESSFFSTATDAEGNKLFPNFNPGYFGKGLQKKFQNIANIRSAFKNKKNNRSLAALEPGLMQLMLDVESMRNALPKDFEYTPAQQASMQSFQHYRDNLSKVLHTKVLGKWTDEFFGGRNGGTFIPERLFEGPLHWLRRMDEDGNLPANVTTLVAMATHNFIATQGIGSAYYSNDQLEQVYKNTTIHQLPAENLRAASVRGTMRHNAVDQIGTQIFNGLDITDHRFNDGYLKERLILSLGLMGVMAMEQSGLFTHSSAPMYEVAYLKGNLNREMYEDLKANDDGTGETVPFIRIALNPAHPERNEPSALAIKISDRHKDIGPIFEQIANMQNSRREPTENQAKPATSQIPGSINEVHPTTQERLNQASSVATVADRRFEEVAKNLDFNQKDPEKKTLDNQALRTILGWKPVEDAHKTEKESQEGKNRGVIKQIQDLQYMLTKGDSPWFDRFLYKQNGRWTKESNVLNYQSSKLHRSAYKIPDFTNTVDKTDAESVLAFMFAVGFGSGAKKGDAKVDKMLQEDMLEAVTEQMNNPVIKAGWEAIRDNDYSKQGVSNIVAAVDKMGEGAFSLDTLIAWVDYENAGPDGKFESNLPAEVDGLTNGYALGLLMMPGADPMSPVMLKAYNRVGVFFKSQNGIDSVAKAKTNQPDNERFYDVYEALALETGKIQRDILTGKEYEKAQQSESMEDWEIDNAEKAKQYMPFMQRMMPDVATIMNEAKEAVEEIDVGGDGRNFSKDPFMIANYGAVIKTIIRNLSAVPLKKFYERINKLRVNLKHQSEALNRRIAAEKDEKIIAELTDEKEQLRREALNQLHREFKALQQAVGQGFPKGHTFRVKNEKGKLKQEWFYREESPNTGLPGKDIVLRDIFGKDVKEVTVDEFYDVIGNYEVPKDVAKILQSRMRLTLGMPAGQGMEVLLEPQLKIKNTMIETFGQANFFYYLAFDERRKKWIEDNFNQVPTRAQEEEIHRQLRDEGMIPMVRTYDAKDDPSEYKYYLDLSDRDTKPVEEDESISKARVYYSEEATNKPSESLSQAATRARPIVGAPPRPLPLMIHMTDATIMSLLMTRLGIDPNGPVPMMNVFDAYLANPQKMHKLTVEANKIIAEVTQNYSPVHETHRMMQRMAESLEKPENASLKKRMETQPASSIEDSPSVLEVFESQLAEIEALDGEVTANRAVLAKNAAAYNQFSKDESHYQAQDFDAVSSQTVVDPNTLFSPEGGAQSAEDAVQSISGTVKEHYEAVDRLARENGHPPLDPQHKEQLDIVMEILQSGLTELDQITQVLRADPKDAVTRGHWDVVQEKVYISTAAHKNLNPDVMSPQETAVHEYVHAVLREALNDPKNASVRQQVEDLMDQAREEITPEQLGSQRYWDHIFNNPDGEGVHEFLSIGLTNPKMLAALKGMRPSKRNQYPKNLFYKLIHWLGVIVDNFFRTRRNRADSASALLSLAQDLANLNVQKAEFVQSSWTKKPGKALEAVNAKIHDKVKDVAKLAFFRTTNRSDEKLDESVKQFESLVRDVGTTMKKDIEAATGTKMDGFLDNVAAIWQEVAGLPNKQKAGRLLNTATKVLIDQRRKKISDTVRDVVSQFFDPKSPLTDNDSRALNDGLLRTDVSSLLAAGYNMTQIHNIMADQDYRDTAIREVQNSLKKAYGDQGIAFKNQAAGLGQVMAGKGGLASIDHQMMNATAIVRQYFLLKEDRVPVRNPENAIAQVDALATMEAIDRMDAAQRFTVARIMRQEAGRGEGNDGVLKTLLLHAQNKQQALEQQFDSNPVSMTKGYTYENLDPDLQIEIAHDDTLTNEDMAARGFTRVQRLPSDPDVPDSPPMILWHSKIGLGKYRSGAVSTVDRQARGTTLTRQEQHLGNAKARRIANDKFNQASKIKFKKTKDKIFSETLNLTQPSNNTVVPVLNPEEGTITAYRYMMTDKTKRELLGRDDKLADTLGKMFGDIHTKAGTLKSHVEAANFLVPYYEENMGKEKFIFLNPKSDNPKAVEGWRRMPSTMKRAIKAAGGDPNNIPIPANMYNYLLGQRDITIHGTLADWKYKKKYGTDKIPMTALLGIRLIEDAWKDIVNIAKAKISVLVPQVVIGNMTSNMMLLTADGIPPDYILKKGKEGYRALIRYQGQLQKIDRLKIELATTGSFDQKERIKRRIIELEGRLAANPVHAMYETGLFSAITEEVTPESFEPDPRRPISYMLSRMESLGRKLLGEKGTGLGRELLMSPGSATFAAAITANQIGDFVGRYVKYNYDLKERKLDEGTARNNAMDDFINYDENLNKYLQFANDYGFAMFLKYTIRIQRVILKLFAKTPAHAALTEALSAKVGHPYLSTVNDSLLLPSHIAFKADINPFMDRLNDAIGLPLWEWIRVPYDMVSG